MSRGALDGLRIVEYANFISGPYCSKLLADLGAEVIKIEEPGVGDEARQTKPFLNDVPHPERSGLFLYLNTNKLGITLNLKTAAGLKVLKELLREADIFVENSSPLAAKELGIDYENLKEVNPGLIVTSITPFGQTGPYRDYKATDLISCNMGGLGYNTPGAVQNTAEQPPLRPGGRQTDFVAGTTGTMATLFALFARQTTGHGQHVDISQQEAIASFVRMEIAFYTYNSERYLNFAANRQRPSSAVGFLPCKDGYIANGCREEYQWQHLFQTIAGTDQEKEKEIMSLFDGEELSIAAVVQKWDIVQPLILDWTMKHTREEIFQMALANDFPITPCNTMDELFSSPQLAEREYFVEIDHSATGVLKYPGPPFKLDKTPCQVRRPAPLLGEHNEEILCQRLGYSKQDLEELRERHVI